MRPLKISMERILFDLDEFWFMKNQLLEMDDMAKKYIYMENLVKNLTTLQELGDIYSTGEQDERIILSSERAWGTQVHFFLSINMVIFFFSSVIDNKYGISSFFQEGTKNFPAGSS